MDIADSRAAPATPDRYEKDLGAYGLKYVGFLAVAISGLLGSTAHTTLRTDATPYAVLEVAVDSLPLFLRETWGRPGSFNLNEVRSPRSFVRPEGSRTELLLLDSLWVEGQVRQNRWVVGRCSAALGWECELNGAEMNVQFDWRWIGESDDVVEILVMFDRRQGGPPGGQGGFGADVLARFERVSGRWILAEHSVISIT